MLVFRFQNESINEAIAQSNQQLVKFYEDNNLRLGCQQEFIRKLDLTWVRFFKKLIVYGQTFIWLYGKATRKALF